MKQRILEVLLSALLMVTMSGCSTGSNDTAGKKEDSKPIRINIATATTGGAFYPAGLAAAQIIKEFTGIEASASTSSGSVENVTLLANGEANIVVQQSDVFDDAYNGKGKFEGKPHKNMRILIPIVSNTYNILVRKGSDINSLKDWRGKRVVVGAAGSGMVVTHEKILGSFGITLNDIDANYIGINEAINALRNGMADATMAIGAPPLSGVSDALAAPGTNVTIYSLTPEEEKTILDQVKWMAPMDIEAGTYPNQKETINAIGHTGFFAVRDDMPEEVAYKIVKAMYENKDKLIQAYNGYNGPAFLKPGDAINALPVPLHPGAEKALKELGILK